MNILLNGYHYGGNTPQFIPKIKELGHNVKLIYPTALDMDDLLARHALSPVLTTNDVIFPNYSKVEKFLIRTFKKFRMKLWQKIIIIKLEELIKRFETNVIWNHAVNERTLLMVKTKFSPQVTLPYGSDLMTDKTPLKYENVRYILNNSTYIQAVQEEFKKFVINKYKISDVLYTKEYFQWGLPGMHSFLKQNFDNMQIKKKYSIPERSVILFDSRGMRQISAGALNLAKATKQLLPQCPDLFLILSSGFTANTSVIDELKDYTIKNNIEDRTLIITEPLEYVQILELYSISNIYFSLLPTDVLGKAIMEAIAFNCLLVLTDWQEYRNVFGDCAEYVEHENEKQLIDAIIKSINFSKKERQRRIIHNKGWLFETQDFDKNTRKLIEFFEHIKN